MNIEEIREYCLAKPGITEGFPINDTALVFLSGLEDVCPAGSFRGKQGYQPEM